MADLKTQGKIDQFRGKIRSTWGQLTDDDFDRAKGDSETLVGTIKEKTGEASEDIRAKLDELFRDDEDVNKR
jgi:uncharacterized protein YjbJ (UPF0337 family)